MPAPATSSGESWLGSGDPFQRCVRSIANSPILIHANYIENALSNLDGNHLHPSRHSVSTSMAEPPTPTRSSVVSAPTAQLLNTPVPTHGTTHITTLTESSASSRDRLTAHQQEPDLFLSGTVTRHNAGRYTLTYSTGNSGQRNATGALLDGNPDVDSDADRDELPPAYSP